MQIIRVKGVRAGPVSSPPPTTPDLFPRPLLFGSSEHSLACKFHGDVVN